jgi:hypothetical protein
MNNMNIRQPLQQPRNFLFNWKKKSVASTAATGRTLPPARCQNGFPANINMGGGGTLVHRLELLYSIWCSYQQTAAAQFVSNQSLNFAPTGNEAAVPGPQNIFIIRHGEKNTSGTEYCLNNNGIYRACHLVDFVNQLAVQGTPISYIITCLPCAYNTDNSTMHPQQTISMVSFLLNIPMYIYGNSQDFNEIVTPLFESGIFNGLNVLIVWEHTAIQSLVLKILHHCIIKSAQRINYANKIPVTI